MKREWKIGDCFEYLIKYDSSVYSFSPPRFYRIIKISSSTPHDKVSFVRIDDSVVISWPLISLDGIDVVYTTEEEIFQKMIEL